MRKSNIIFEEVRVEMAKQNLGITEMASRLHCNRDTLSRKLSGKTMLTLDEAFEIQRTFFPDKDIISLFKEVMKETNDGKKAG